MFRNTLLALTALLAVGCVSKAKYAALESQLSACNSSLEACKAKGAETKERVQSSDHAGLLAAFKPLVDKGVLQIEERDGRTVIAIGTEVLFPSGSAALSDVGKANIVEVARVLGNKGGDVNWQIEGHTDNQPIATAEFPDNWALGSARALAVLEVMVANGVAPEHISAATYGQYSPVAANGDDAGRAQNRRIEITVVPDFLGTKRLKR